MAALAAFGSDGRPSGAYPFVFVHGAGADASRFGPLLTLVPEAVALDLPGHGGAGGEACAAVDGPGGYAQAVADLLRREGYERPILVGHSLGGAIALSCALAGVPALGGIGLVASGARLRVHPDILAALAARHLPESLDLPAMMFAPDAPAPLVAAEARALALGAASGVLHADFAASDAFDVQDRLAELRLPAAVVVGSRDRMTPPRLSERLIAGWGDPARVEGTVVDGAGHYAQLERPQAVARALLRLRQRVREGAAS